MYAYAYIYIYFKRAVQSILDGGYIIPGSKNTNNVIKKKHGSAYGIGVYSSPFFDKANYYAAANNGYVYILINIVLLGTFKMVPPSSGAMNTSAPLRSSLRESVSPGDTFSQVPLNGCYADGSNTRIVFGLEQLVSADTTRIIPVGVMKISVN